jgi:hypothetical protein
LTKIRLLKLQKGGIIAGKNNEEKISEIIQGNNSFQLVFFLIDDLRVHNNTSIKDEGSYRRSAKPSNISNSSQKYMLCNVFLNFYYIRSYFFWKQSKLLKNYLLLFFSLFR